MSNNTYPIKCHVCGREFGIQAPFLSVPMWAPDPTTGKSFGFATCNLDRTAPDLHHPRPGEDVNIIRQSYAAHGSPQAGRLL